MENDTYGIDSGVNENVSLEQSIEQAPVKTKEELFCHDKPDEGHKDNKPPSDELTDQVESVLTANKKDESNSSESVTFKVIFNKNKHDVKWELDKTVLSLKNHIQTLTNVAPAMQKLMFKGLAKDEKTLRELGVTKGSKMMLVGSKLQDVISINTVNAGASASEDEKAENKKEPLSKQKPHAKVIEKGVPDDVMPGYSNGKEPLPSTPLKGMVNKFSNKVRLTFKLEADQLWLGTKDRTEKLPLNSIKDVVSESIDDHPGYHMLALQLGPTVQSRYWIYWVPSQYVDAIKDAILGKWQMF
ncbi:ubiquitin domain-containing protein UBFD1-like isoform X2 [Styela clava]